MFNDEFNLLPEIEKKMILATYPGALEGRPHLTIKKARQSVRIMMRRMGLGTACGRCGGTGHYSYNPVHGTTCYGCEGWKFVFKFTEQNLHIYTSCVADESARLERNIAEAKRLGMSLAEYETTI